MIPKGALYYVELRVHSPTSLSLSVRGSSFLTLSESVPLSQYIKCPQSPSSAAPFLFTVLPSFRLITLISQGYQDRCYTPRRPSLRGEGDRYDKLLLFKTMAYVQANILLAYVQANILLCTTYMTPKEDLFERARTFQDSFEATMQIIPPSTGPCIPIIAGSCRWYYPSTMRRCWAAREPVESRCDGHSNIVGAPSLLHLHRAAEMVAAMATSVPSDSHSPPGRQRGLPGRAPRRRELQVVLFQYYKEVLGFNCDATATQISSEHRASSAYTEQQIWPLRW